MGTPNAGRVAALVDLLAEDDVALALRPVVLILVGDGLEALDLVQGQYARAGLADADPLVLAVRGLVAGEGQGPERPMDGGIGRVDRAVGAADCLLMRWPMMARESPTLLTVMRLRRPWM